jgi:hypothetical protein
MKKTILIICAFVFGFLGAQAQQQKDEIQLIQAKWGLEKRDIVSNYMKFNASEAKAFWPVYDAFQTDLRALGKERMILISDYVNNFESTTNEKADRLATELLDNNVAYEKLNAKYYNKIKKVISPLRAAAYIQLETYIQTSIRVLVQDNITMIGELDRKANK